MPQRMTIGDLVSFGDRLYYLRGVDPFGVAERNAHLEDVERGTRVRARLQDVAKVTDDARTASLLGSPQAASPGAHGPAEQDGT